MKKKYSHSLLIGLGLLCTTVLMAQSAFMQTDRQVYAAGERVRGFCKAALEGSQVEGVKIKIELEGSEGEKILHFFTSFDSNGLAGFAFDLPYDSKGGSYLVTGHVLNAGKEIKVYTGGIGIVNPVQPLDRHVFGRLPSFAGQISEDKEEWCFIEKTEDQIQLRINRSPGFSLLSLALVENESVSHANVYAGLVPDDVWDGCNTWSRNLWLTGKTTVRNKNYGVNILGMYCNETDSIWMTKSDTSGYFFIQVNPFTGTRHFQPIVHSSEKKEVSLGPWGIEHNISSTTPIDSQRIRQYYDLSQIRSYVKSYYGQHTGDGVGQKAAEVIESGLKPQKSYIISDYNKFETMREFCSENDSPLRFGEVDGKYAAELLIPGKYAKKFNARASNPLFIVNGQLVKNEDLIARMKTDEVARMDLYMDVELLRKRYSVFGADGAIKIKTNGRLEVLSTKQKSEIFSLTGMNPVYPSVEDELAQKLKELTPPVLSPILLFDYRINESNSIKFRKVHERSEYILYGVFKDTRGQLLIRKTQVDLK